MGEIQYLSVNKKQGAKKRQLLNSPKIHINHTYMNSTTKVGKLSFAEINSNKSLINLQGETWKDISGLEGYYQISNLGRIKSLDREVPHRRVAGSQVTRQKGKVLNLRLNNSNYVVYSVSKEKKSYHGTIHRLVAKAFIPNPENKPCVNHKDSNRENNRVENLEWVTYKENTAHAIDTGSLNHKGANNSCSKFTNRQVSDIRKRLSNGETGYSIAKEFGVSDSTIFRIKHKQVYK